MDNENKNTMRGMMKEDYDDIKLSKDRELNESMTITETSQDEYTRKIHNIGGSNNGE